MFTELAYRPKRKTRHDSDDSTDSEDNAAESGVVANPWLTISDAQESRSSLSAPALRAEIFMELYEAMLYFLAAWAKQELSPFKTSPSKVQDRASDREWSSSSCNSTMDIATLDKQLMPDQPDMPGVVHTTSSGSALPTVTDRKDTSRDKEWEARKERASGMLLRLIQWKNEFCESDLRAMFGGTSAMTADLERAIRSLLLSIGEKLSDLVEYQMDKPRMNERLRAQAVRLDDRVQRGKEAQGNLRNLDDLSSIFGDSWITSDSLIVSSTELIHPVDRKLEEVDVNLDTLVDMDIPDLLKKSISRRKSRLRMSPGKMSPFGGSLERAFPNPLGRHVNPTLHTFSEKVSTPVISETSLPLPSLVVPPYTPPGPSRIRNPSSPPGLKHISRSKTVLPARKMRKTKDTCRWATAQERLDHLQRCWRLARASPDLKQQSHHSKPVHLTLSISFNPTEYQVDKFRASLARFEQSQREHADSLGGLTNLFSSFRVRDVASELLSGVVEVFRGLVPKVSHGPISDSPLLEAAESMDFTLALLESLPHWLLYTNVPDSKRFAKALGVSVQTALLDEFWDSCANMFREVRETSLSLGRSTDSTPARQRYVLALLIQRVERLRTLQVGRALVLAWDILRPIVRELVSELRNCVADMAEFEAKTEKQAIALPASPSPTVIPSLRVSASEPPPSIWDRMGSTSSAGSTSTPHLTNNVVPAIEAPSLAPAHILCYAMLRPEDGLYCPINLLRHELTTSAGLMGEETKLGTPMCTIRIGDELVN